jgi:indolepyruvate ferredoxin oxidoreductase
LGVKTTIDQSSCNLDFSCLAGDCPSFMTVEIDPDRSATSVAPVVPNLPGPPVDTDLETFDMRVVGIGGTGVVTASQIVATAAMLDDFDVRGLDQTGLSQKAGQVSGDIRLRRGAPPTSNLIGTGGADLLLGFDLLASASTRSLSIADPERTIVVASSTEVPTGSMVGRPDIEYPQFSQLRQRVDEVTRAEKNVYVNAGSICDRYFGGTATANIFLLGVAVQSGVLPVQVSSIQEAIRLNGVAVDANLAAFAAGRHWVVNPDAYDFQNSASAASQMAVPPLPKKLAARIEGSGLEPVEIVTLLAADLVAYQNNRYAGRFLDLVEKVVSLGSVELTEAVARGFHKLMAYKDEYEVARLLVGPEGAAAAAAVGGPDANVTWKLHPPMLKALGMDNKVGVPTSVGLPAMKALAKGKRLRGTKLDPFGRAEVRVVERAMIEEFEAAMVTMLNRARSGEVSIDDAVAVAQLPMDVRGYEDLKLKRAATFRKALSEL